MRRLFRFKHFALAWLLIACGITGCQTGENTTAGFSGNTKTQGVYTTIAIPDLGLDLPATGYMEKSSFGPGETPAAVIVGYGDETQPQSVSLNLTEGGTGRSLLSQDLYAIYGKATLLPLAIRLSGNYELRLTSGGTALDSFQFTVSRTNRSGALQIDNSNPGQPYAVGNFFVALAPGDLLDFFAKYNDQLIYSMLNAVTQEAGSTNRDLFAQRFPGKVVIHCRQDFHGNVTGTRTLENTLDDDCARVFQNALQGRSPYDPWPEDAHRKLGSDSRDLTVTINFD